MTRGIGAFGLLPAVPQRGMFDPLTHACYCSLSGRLVTAARGAGLRGASFARADAKPPRASVQR